MIRAPLSDYWFKGIEESNPFKLDFKVILAAGIKKDFDLKLLESHYRIKPKSFVTLEEY